MIYPVDLKVVINCLKMLSLMTGDLKMILKCSGLVDEFNWRQFKVY